MRKRLHNFCIKRLVKSGCFATKDIDTEKRTIYCGMWGIKLVFMEPRHQFWLSVLVKWCRYKLLEGTLMPTATWGEPFENVQNRYEQFDKSVRDEVSQIKGRRIASNKELQIPNDQTPT